MTATRSVVVDAPVDRVWARVGGFCNITEWMNSPEWEDCRYLQGSGAPGSVRSRRDPSKTAKRKTAKPPCTTRSSGTTPRSRTTLHDKVRRIDT
ncbi:SRPBCC family protein [Tunturibacter empetritectus]|uniref:SRPBCC family protein n=1 Tax=Tunturiibacter empetritectus TaxID=3069691 RepID=UPI00161CDC89